MTNSGDLPFDFGALSDVGNERSNNEDSYGHLLESETSIVFAVADGVGGYEGGEWASRLAVDVTLDAYQTSPAAWGSSKRLARAVQRANIEIHDKTVVVPELSRMATTLTAVSVSDGVLNAAHVGDCRLYLLRKEGVTQLTKDHAVRGNLTRSLGPELIVAADRITTPLVMGDVVILCSDGVYKVLERGDIESLARDGSAAETCRKLVGAANERKTTDNLTVAVLRITSPTPTANLPPGWRERFQKLFPRLR